jgi:hypothetical protein
VDFRHCQVLDPVGSAVAFPKSIEFWKDRRITVGMTKLRWLQALAGRLQLLGRRRASQEHASQEHAARSTQEIQQ